MQIQLTEREVALLEEAARQPSRPPSRDSEVLALLLAMQLVVQRDGILEITLLGQHVLKLSRGTPRDDRSNG